MARAAGLVLLLLAAAAPTPQDLEDAERARAGQVAIERDATARAAAAEERERSLVQARLAAAARLRHAEDALATAAARVADLADRRAVAAAKLAATATALAPMLPVIERLSLYPAETLLATPMPPEQAVRGAIVLAALSQGLERQAETLRSEQATLAAAQVQLTAALPGLGQAQAAQARLAADLDARIIEARQVRMAAQDAAADAAIRAAAEAARAEGLRAVIARIEAERRIAEARAREQAAAAERRRQAAEAAAARSRQETLARPAGPGLGEPRGQLVAPVAGSVLQGFGAAGDAGPASGISYRTPPGARVVSPCGGRVVFAGPFRSYGQLLIVDCGGGFHFVLAGLDRLDAAAGQPVQPGDPVGVMAGWDPLKPGAARPTLYLELRKDGDPVNPAPFLRARS
jgi:septal ring factor EnvC (AmiA/AmiB activator)